MKLKDFNYNLPEELIAQKQIKPRDHSRLLVLKRLSALNDKKSIEHKYFYDLIDYLQKGDCLVLNNSRVFPARLVGHRLGTGGKVEIFLLRKLTNIEVWQCLVGGHRRKENLVVEFGNGLKAKIIRDNKDGTFLVSFNKKGTAFKKIINKIGQTPLPPYIKRNLKFNPESRVLGTGQNSKLNNDYSRQKFNKENKEDEINYQTVYANNRKIGSVAAPTAGLHFTKELLMKIKKKGVEIVEVTLHVGLGTFAPVKTEDIIKHKMHSEWVEVDKETIAKILKAKQEGRRVIAVGTTSVRTLESIFRLSLRESIPNTRDQDEAIPCQKRMPRDPHGSAGWQSLRMTEYCGFTDIFIYPSYKFKIVDAMITNFHLPKSTLLMLVSAFAGKTKIKNAYEQAIKRQYRFYSYGDAMLII